MMQEAKARGAEMPRVQKRFCRRTPLSPRLSRLHKVCYNLAIIRFTWQTLIRFQIVQSFLSFGQLPGKDSLLLRLVSMHNLIPHFIYEQYRMGNYHGRFQAVALFLDISGFTAMTQALMQHGKEGAEIMAGIINQIFDPVIHAVYEREGFITGFAGDAFTALFPAPAAGNNLQQAAVLACDTAIAICRLFAEHKTQTTQFGPFTLTVKQGLSAGQVEWGIVGPEEHNSYFFRGEAIDGCVQAEHRAGGGDVVLDDTVQALLPQAMASRAAIDRRYVRLLELNITAMAPTRSNPLPMISSRLAATFFNRSLWKMSQQGEFRSAAIVFISFEEIATVAELNAFISHIIATADSFGGHFSEVDFGDKGSVLLTYFGAPQTHENDVERALNFILDLRHALPDAGRSQRWRAGITFGMIYAGFIGIPLRDKYTALGSVVNLASRLMTQAEWGQVLVAAEVAQQPGFTFDYQGDGSYKGFGQPVPTYQLLGATTKGRRSVTQKMVGREKELQQLLDFARPLFAGRLAGAAILYGEAGIGKSSLAYALQQALSHRPEPSQWFTAQTDQILRRPWNPFTYWLKRYFNQLPDADVGENKARFNEKHRQLLKRLARTGEASKSLVAELQRTRPFLGALIDLHWPGSLYEQLDAQLRHENMITAVTTLLLAESRLCPVVFELEDGHWLDEASQEMLTNLSREIAGYPLLLVITARYADDGSRPSFKLDERVPRVTLDLTALSPAMLQQQASDILGGPIDATLLALLQDRTQANPFFVQQMLHFFQENGLLVQTATGTWTYPQNTAQSSFPNDQLPGTINAILVARIDRLAQEVKDVVQTAAVLGQEIVVPILSHMLRRDTLPQVKQAAQAQIWTLLSELRYLFKHALLRDAAYEMQLREQLRELHYLAATTYQQLYADNLSPYYADLAYHFRQAEAVVEERSYAQLAGEQAAGQYAHEKALHFLDRALSLTPESDMEARYILLQTREGVYSLLGKREAQAADLETLMTLADRLGDVRWRAETAVRQGEYHVATGDYKAAVAVLKRATRWGRQVGARALESQAYVNMGRAFTYQGQYGQAEEQYQRALSLAQTANAAVQIARIYDGLGIVARHQGNYSTAIRQHKNALAIWRQIDDKQGMAYSVINLGDVVREQGDNTLAHDYYRQSLVLRRQIGDRQSVAVSLSSLGTVAHQQGDYPTAQDYHQQSLAIRRGIGDKRGVAGALSNLGLVAYRQGDYPNARDYYRRSLAIRREIGDRRGVAISLYTLGHLAYKQEAYLSARDYHERCLAIRREIGDRQGVASSLNVLGEVARQQGQYGEAQHYYRQALAIQQEIGDRGNEAITLLNLAHIAPLFGDREAALNSARQALAITQATGARFFEAAAYLELGKALAETTQWAEAVTVLHQSLEMWQELGVQAMTMETRAALGRLYLAQGEAAQALVVSEESLAYLDEMGSFAGTEEPSRIYLTCYQVLQANNDPRAAGVLQAGYEALQTKVNAIADEATRQAILQNVPWHQEIVALWTAQQEHNE